MKRSLKDFFLPHAGNNFRPTALEQISVGVMLVLILLSFGMANLQALFWISSDWLVSTVLPSVIVELTNDERAHGDIGTLARSPILDEAARLKAEDMARNNYFAHYSPTGVSPWYWFDTAGYDYLHAGENLAVHFTESDSVVGAWMDSPSHRANIMNGVYTEIGVGTAKGMYNGEETVYVVQLFGTRRATPPASVAGASTNATEPTITIENVRLSDDTSSVAPATVVTETLPEDNTGTISTPSLLKEGDPLPPTTVAVSEGSETLTSTDAPFIATTSREGVPAIMDDVAPPYDNAPALRVAVEPSLWLEVLYSVLALFVLVMLTISLVTEWRRHHPLQMAYASGLLLVMALLLYVHTTLTGIVVIA